MCSFENTSLCVHLITNKYFLLLNLPVYSCKMYILLKQMGINYEVCKTIHKKRDG